MKRLYVGCRVRVNCPGSNSHGAETRIVSEIAWWPSEDPPFWGHEVDIPLLPETATYPGELAAFEPHELEPIQDPGHEVISWEEMRGLWTPSEVTA